MEISGRLIWCGEQGTHSIVVSLQIQILGNLCGPKKMRGSLTLRMEYSSTRKKNEAPTHAAMWMDHDNVKPN